MAAPRSITLAAIALALAAGTLADARRPHAAPPAGPLRPGAYVCEGAGAGMFPLAVLPGFHYRAAGPAGRYVAAGQTLRFIGGSLANNIGTLDGSGVFALATVGSRQPYTHCTLAPAKAHGRPTSRADRSRR